MGRFQPEPIFRWLEIKRRQRNGNSCDMMDETMDNREWKSSFQVMMFRLWQGMYERKLVRTIELCLNDSYCILNEIKVRIV